MPMSFLLLLNTLGGTTGLTASKKAASKVGSSSEDRPEVVLPDFSVSCSGEDVTIVRRDGEDRVDVGAGQNDPVVAVHRVPDAGPVLDGEIGFRDFF